MTKTARRFLFYFLSSIFYLLFLATPAFAQSNSFNNTNPDVPNNLHTYTQNVMIEVMSAVVCQLTGIDVVNRSQKCLGVDPQSGKIGFVEGGGGAIGVVTNSIAMLYTPPLHTGDYIHYLARNFGIAKPAYAQQSVGLGGLSPLVSLWTSFRNIVYLLFVFVFVLIGLAIMLRVKIDPRTVMGIQNQIPKIIIGIVLVTFSLGIAGFLIDIMWVSTYLITNVVAGSSPGGNQFVSTVNKEVYSPPIGFVNEVYKSKALPPFDGGVLGLAGQTGLALQVALSKAMSPNSAGDIIKQGIQTGQQKDQCKDIGCGIGTVIKDALFGSIINLIFAALGSVVSWFIGLLAILIVAIALLWALFRLGFELIKAYVFILIDIVIAPFFILAGLIPGSPIGFGMWLRDILANLSAFPTTIAMFLLGGAIIQSIGGAGGDFFVPPLIGNPNTTISGAREIAAFIGLGIVLLTPQVVTMIKETLKAPQFKYGTAIGQAVGVGPAVTGSVAQQVASPYGGLAMFRRGQAALKAKTWAAKVEALTGVREGVLPLPGQGGQPAP